MIDAAHITATTAACTSFLREAVDADWTVAVPDLDMNVAEVVAHAAEAGLWYSIDLTAGGKDLQAVEHRVKPDRPPAEVIDTLETYATIAATVIDAAAPDARGFHPVGTADPSGFAGMTCDELLIHTDDAGRGLERRFDPPPELAEAVLRRLFPWVDVGSDPWAQLLWANGRIALHGQPRLDGWRWHCAPLAEWDGEMPGRRRQTATNQPIPRPTPGS